MKNAIASIVLMFLMASCGTSAKFPVSSVTPAAVITAKMKQDKSNNYVISVAANYLASAERLSPPRKIYVVWIVTSSNGVKNIGQLKSKNGKNSTLDTLSSFEPIEIFITAEDEGTISSPSGTEISRTTFRK